MKAYGEEVVTERGSDARYRMCLCSECEEVQRCTPENDFYEADDGKLLVCSGCFRKSMEAKGYKCDPMV